MERRLTKFGFIFLATLILIFGACRADLAEDAGTGTRAVVDQLGRSVKLPSKITRSVSLAPSLTELVFSAGAGDRLVGVTTYCDFPADAKKIEKIGDVLKPNLERIIALNPQVVFVSTASQLETFSKTLEGRGIEVFVTDPKSIEDIYEGILKMGEVFGETGRARSVVEKLQARVKAVVKKTDGLKRVPVFVQLDKTPFTIGRDSFITAIVQLAGGRSVTSDVSTPYFKVSKERALASMPEVIILSKSPDNDAPNDALSNSPAVKNGRVVEVDADILSRPGPRVFDGLERIALALHPERFER